MVHTAPDYSSRWRSDAINPTLDVSEIARRINPLSSSDARGRMLWFDDCQGTIYKWNIQGFVGGLAYETTDRAYSGSKAYRLETTANANSKVYVNLDVDGGQAGKLGYELLFAEMGNSQFLQMIFSFMDQTDYLVSGLRFDLLNDKIDIDPTNGGLWTKVADHLFDGNNRTYHHAKLVGDAVTHKWLRLVLNGIEYDLSAYDWNRAGAGVCQRVGLSMNLVNSAATAAKMNIGGIMVTDNEP